MRQIDKIRKTNVLPMIFSAAELFPLSPGYSPPRSDKPTSYNNQGNGHQIVDVSLRLASTY